MLFWLLNSRAVGLRRLLVHMFHQGLYICCKELRYRFHPAALEVLEQKSSTRKRSSSTKSKANRGAILAVAPHGNQF